MMEGIRKANSLSKLLEKVKESLGFKREEFPPPVLYGVKMAFETDFSKIDQQDPQPGDMVAIIEEYSEVYGDWFNPIIFFTMT